ncbi:MAG: hypothetical protein J1F01_02450 [Oscillospiraceae bacterium]|nr:hypothetical protein [Oscillospiraceae bacterium]
MKFNSALFKQILEDLEQSQSFIREGNDNIGYSDIKTGLTPKDLAEKHAKGYSVEEARYCVAILYKLDYITTDTQHQIFITQAEHKFILSQLHGIECKY